MKKVLAVLLSCAMLVSTATVAFGATKSTVEARIDTAAAYMDEYYSASGYTVSSNLKNFYILVNADYDVSEYEEAFLASVDEAIEADSLSAYTIGLVLDILYELGYDATDYNGTDLTATLTAIDAYSYYGYYYAYTIEAAAELGLTDYATAVATALCETYYTMGTGTDFWGGWGTSADDLGTFIVGLSYVDGFDEYIEDATALLATYYTDEGYDNYGANTDSTALALAAYSAIGDTENADAAFELLELFYDSTTGGYTASYDEYYATADAVYGLTYYLPLAEDEHTEHTYEGVVTTEATCTEDGIITYTCTVCGDSYSEVISATGHSYAWAINSDSQPEKACTACGDVLVTIPFTDLTDTATYGNYYDRIAYLSSYNSFIHGTTATTYSPSRVLTRAEALTILYRMAGSPYDEANPYEASPFTDVDTTAFYYNAACWALDNGITTETTFKGSNTATRQETVTFLYRYVTTCTNVTVTLSSIGSFPDATSVSDWAINAMKWAYANGLITGNSAGKLNPTGVTYRIYASKIYYQFGLTCGIGNFE